MRSLKKTFLMVSCLLAAGISIAEAGAYDIRENTPEVQSAISGRQSRFSALKQLKAQGAIGENNRGYVDALASTGDAVVLAQAENNDRRVLYQAIVDQNNLGAAGMDKVEMVFAEVQRDKASSGEKIQSPSGEWITR